MIKLKPRLIMAHCNTYIYKLKFNEAFLIKLRTDFRDDSTMIFN